MKATEKQGNGDREAGPEASVEGLPPGLDELILPEDRIQYPDSDEWHRLGATVRAKAGQGTAKAPALRLLPKLALAASFLVLLLLAALWRRDARIESQEAVAEERAVPESVVPAPVGVPLEQQLSELDALTARLELDYVQLELQRWGIADASDPAASVERILERHDIDRTAVYIASEQAL